MCASIYFSMCVFVIVCVRSSIRPGCAHNTQVYICESDYVYVHKRIKFLCMRLVVHRAGALNRVFAGLFVHREVECAHL